jgi:hypothetical protein
VKQMFSRFAGTATLLALLSTTAAAQINLSLLANVDLTPTASTTSGFFIGNNPSAVAWDGSSAWIGGFGANTALIKVSSVLTTPTFGTPFGSVATTTNGFTGLDIKGGRLAAAWDLGANSADSIRLYDVSATNPSLLWRIGDATAANDSGRRGSSGVAFDPGFNGDSGGQGVAFLGFGSGRRALLNEANGTYAFNFSTGMIININPTNTFWRDIDFDPDTGDVYMRVSNTVAKATRTGNNPSTALTTAILSNFTTQGTAATNTINNQNLAFVNAAGQKFIIANDRSATGAGQSLLSVVRAFGLDGTPLALNFGSFAPATGNGAYDFSYDIETQTLAMTDFANRRLYVFGFNQPVANVAPEPGTLSLLFVGGVGFIAARRRRNRR